MLRGFFAALVLCVIVAPVQAQKAPFDVQALLKLARVGEPALSPDGKMVAFTVQSIDLAKNARPKHIWVVPVEGGTPRQITHEGTRNERPQWSPDSKKIAFISDRSGSAQIWTVDPDGQNAVQLTNLSTEAGGLMYSPDGKKILFTSDVFPDCADDDCNRKRLDAERNNPVKARMYTSLLYRHWNEWQTSRRRHLLVIPASGGPAKDLTPGTRDVPPFSLGGPDDYAISPDGAEVCYVMNPDPELATSTNSELHVVPIDGGEAKKITVNPAADNSPKYSPDGKWIAYRMQTRAGYESDRWRLAVMDRTTG
ncbi:MAG: PD40 domain-containing protein, partial [Bryobacteraceae bacterium]|nr:PD40 domain-containing protein [Bryobacteraceae bacterium]